MPRKIPGKLSLTSNDPEEQLVDALVQCQREKVSIERVARILALVFDYKAEVLVEEINKFKK